jgi:cyanophycinase
MTPSALSLLFIGLVAAWPALRQGTPTEHRTASGYDTYLTGDAADVHRPTRGGLQLEGGGTDIPDAFRWLIDHAGGGDIVVIRASGADGYNAFIKELGIVDSVESIVFHSREAAYDKDVLRSLERAEAVFIAGGDQWNYVRFWKGTPVQDALNVLAKRGVPIGGTSAGLAVMGELSFSAMHDTVTSPEALANPYDEKVAIERAFLTMPHMAGIITDSHFVPRDRLGRLLVFLGRIVQDGWAPRARAIAVDQEAAVLVEADGSARVVGKAPAYFMETTQKPDICRPGTPLTLHGVNTFRVAPGENFDLKAWKTASAPPYVLAVDEGKVSSSTGHIY